MAKTSGGINVFQRNNKNGKPQFTFFKSVKTFCLDVKEKTQAADEQRALAYWDQHSSLYAKKENVDKLFESIKQVEPYNNENIQGKMKKP